MQTIKRPKHTRRGISAIEIVIIIAVVGVLGVSASPR